MAETRLSCPFCTSPAAPLWRPEQRKRSRWRYECTGCARRFSVDAADVRELIPAHPGEAVMAGG